jgi:NADH:ubiquinone oxidoreductase subunit E
MPSHTIDKLKKAHRVLYEYPFEVVQLEKGYARRWLRIDLNKPEAVIKPVTQQMIDLWTGGKGFDLWLMFQEISKDTRWDDPENPICFSPGPLGGTTSFPGSGKTLVTALSPLTHSVMDCNVGGFFGPYLKFSGFDALMVTGKAAGDVIVVIDGVAGRVTVEEAPLESIDSHLVAEELTEMYADSELDKRNVAVVSAGRGAENTYMGVLNFSFYDWRRRVARLKQAGRGGVGTVFRNKKIKALVIKNRDISPAWRVTKSKVEDMVVPKELPKCDCGSEIVAICEKWKNDPDYAIEIMQDVQDRFRCIPPVALEVITGQTGTPKAYLYHIATFFKSFSLEEKGEKIIEVCMGTTCHVKGAANILDSFERELNIKTGDTTPDKKFTLEAVACLGACSIAPVIKVGDEVIGNVQSKDIQKILKKAAEQ